MSFEPIAIVGWSCVLPGALDPEAFGRAVLEGRDLVTPADSSRWRLPPAHFLKAMERAGIAPGVGDRGGFVRGFDEIFDPRGFGVDAEIIGGMDPLFRWVLHTGREALRSVGYGDAARVGATRTGAVFGNLSYPSEGMARWTEASWLDAQRDVAGGRARELAGATYPDPRNRFMSGSPAAMLRAALGLREGAFALDAACASSIYAIKLACDRLHDGQADMMLAGAVCRVDQLNIHTGFGALKAFSPTGRSRPFHCEADGLLPAEGAAFVVLKRLADAVRASEPILGVIRGVGLSCDGRSAGLLAPSAAGQARAIRQAYEVAGLTPADVSLLECHATGTPLGDAAELESTGQVFAGLTDVPLGSVKSNIGHSLTVAGMAALTKVLTCMKAGLRAPTLHADRPLSQLGASPFRLLTAQEPWTVRGGPRRAGISAFGFGGNNAHLIVEEWEPRTTPSAASLAARAKPARPPMAIVGVGVLAAGATGERAVAASVLGGETRVRHASESSGKAAPHDEITLQLRGLRFSPNDLAKAIPQQNAILAAAHEALADVKDLPRDRTSVMVGMGCDTEVCRWGVRLRVEGWSEKWGAAAGWFEEAREAVTPELGPAGVLGVMPNIVANRLTSQFDFGGPSFCVSSEERSGLDALTCASRALAAGEIDAALVGAVDLSCEPAHAAAAHAVLGRDEHVPGDAAVVLIIKRLSDAQAAGDAVYAVLHDEAPTSNAQNELDESSLSSQLGHAHAASGLLAVAIAAAACKHGLHVRGAGALSSPWFAPPAERLAVVRVAGPNGASEHWVTGGSALASAPTHPTAAPRVRLFSGADRAAVIRALESRIESRDGESGPARLALVSTDAELDALAKKALSRLRDGAPSAAGTARLGEDIFYRDAPIGGEVAFVFAGPGGAYRGMGRELVTAFPELVDRLTTRFGDLGVIARWVYEDTGDAVVTPADALWGASLLTQLHAEFSRGTLKLAPHAAIGFCSGETNSLFAMGAWNDFRALKVDLEQRGVYDRELAGEFAVAGRAWAKRGVAPAPWRTWRLAASVDAVRAAIASEPLAYLTLVQAPGDVVIAGQADSCARVVAKVGAAKARELEYNLTIHTPEMAEFAPEWRAIHTRPTTPVPGVRFYTHATGTHYVPTAETAADALVGQACSTVDFPRLVENAYDDGIRVFIEHGPQGGCASWIRRTLTSRPHLAVSLDSASVSPLRQALGAASELWASGVAVDIEGLAHRLLALGPAPALAGPTRAFPAHWPAVRFPSLAAATVAPAPLRQTVLASPKESIVQLMEPAPWLPAVLDVPDDLPPQKHDHVVPPPHAPYAPLARAARPHAATSDLQVTPVHAQADGRLGELGVRYAHLVAHQVAAHQTFLATARGAFDHVLRLTGDGVATHGAFQQKPSAPQRSFVPVVTASAPLYTPPPAPPSTALTAVAVAPLPSTPSPRVVAAPPAVAPSPPVPAAPVRALPVGPRFSRADLETLASGNISSVFGPTFRQQDGYARQVRMPEPPLLLADRVTGIDGPEGVLGRGTIWTETDIGNEAWYLHDGRMPAGIFIESGQADLLLISWMGIDFVNKGERVYRLLGCEVTFHGGLPERGDTLRYRIDIDGHAEQAGMRLFFFHYDCHVGDSVRMSVRRGQAGFFTDQELKDSKGVLWSPETHTPTPDARVDAPIVRASASSFDAAHVRAFANGRPHECFGAGFELMATHTRSPGIEKGRMQLFDEVTHFDPKGGVWGRGYLRVTKKISPDDWFFDGHFKGDPCMPGTLMLQATLQAMAFYLAALGYTIDRDGWRFEPVANEPIELQCRGQVIPTSHELVAEIFVEEVYDGPIPTIYAHVLGTVDGLKSLYGRRVGLRCVSDWPLTSMREAFSLPPEKGPVARTGDFEFGYESLLSCAWGRPSRAFGPGFSVFDDVRRCPRLPGPPFHFMSRVTMVDGPFGEPKAGVRTELEYDIPEAAWYFDADRTGKFPFTVLLEAALQPCGWTAAYRGLPLTSEEDLYFRNLEGTATQHHEISPTDGTLRTEVAFTNLAKFGSNIIEAFEVKCFLGTKLVYTMTTRFGHFPKEALAQQAGLPMDDAMKTLLAQPSDFSVDLTTKPERYFDRALHMPVRPMLMIDRVTGYWPTQGKAGLGVLRAEKDIDHDQWFFKAHFFQDPVQPGSLGLEAMIQVLRFCAIERDLGAGMKKPRFEPLAIGKPVSWKYRGQVRPWNKRVTVDVEITKLEGDARGRTCEGNASLWVDGTRIYEATGMCIRVVDDAATS